MSTVKAYAYTYVHTYAHIYIFVEVGRCVYVHCSNIVWGGPRCHACNYGMSQGEEPPNMSGWDLFFVSREGTRTHAHMHAYIRTYVHTYMHTYMHTCIHAYMHACCMRTYMPDMHMYVYAHIQYASIRTYMHAFISCHIRLDQNIYHTTTISHHTFIRSMCTARGGPRSGHVHEHGHARWDGH